MTAMPSYLFETTDVPMFSVTQGGKEMKFSEVPVTQNDAPKNTFNVKVKEIDKQKNLFSVEIETKSSKPVTVTESNVPIGYQPLNPSVTIHTYDIAKKNTMTNTNPNTTYPLKVAFTKSFVGDNGGFMQAVERAQSGEQTLTSLLKNLFIPNTPESKPLFVLKKRQKNSEEDYAVEELIADEYRDDVQIAAYSTSPVDNKTGFTAIIDVLYDTNDEFIISETGLLSDLYTSSGDAYFVSPKLYNDQIVGYNSDTSVQLPFDKESTIKAKFGEDFKGYILLPAGTTLDGNKLDTATYISVNMNR